ncbi:uncharacterized protein LOC117182021 [Belonocnema kinseyi]|uniref:uncharacterized protein LOC117182021 n=1 Tax=Belonocnema kinseyi TaxID=2817044 RepID=UPI00143CD4BA|nr:uncharacterized protein LOC117182021 [Belonocnema kinseyi]
MIFYCQDAHRAEHWPDHKDLCKTIVQMLEESGSSDLFQNMNKKNVVTWTREKFSLISEVESKLDRKLLDFEKEMFLFPKVCLECFENISLETCNKCGISFCNDDRRSVRHQELCKLFLLTFSLENQLLTIRQSTAPIASIEMLVSSSRKSTLQSIPFVTRIESLPKSMDQFISYIELDDQDIWERENPEKIPEIRQWLYSQVFTRPLTCFYGLEKLERWLESMVVHVIAAADDEKCEGGYWEVLLHLVPSLKNLRIVFIGSEVTELDPVAIDVCSGCFERGKSLVIEGVDLRYEDYFLTKFFKKPDIVIAYSLFVAENKLTLSENLRKTILTLGKVDAPFIVTEEKFSKNSIASNFMKIVLGPSATPLKMEVNLFKGDIIKRDILSGTLCYLNYGVLVYSGLYGLPISPTNEHSDSRSEHSEIEEECHGKVVEDMTNFKLK